MAEQSKAVFLSYASEDQEAARRVCDTLRAAGVEVWFDQSALRGGDAWDASIRRQIRSCALFLPIISANAHAREEGYFRLEWKLAIDRSHLMAGTRAFLLPVVIDGTAQEDERIPERFRELQWSRLPGGNAPAGFVQRVRQLLSNAEPDPAAWVAVPEHVRFFPVADFTGHLYLELWARAAGVGVTARLFNLTDGVDAVTTETIVSTVPVSVTLPVTVRADKVYRLEVLPSIDGEAVFGIGTLGD